MINKFEDHLPFYRQSKRFKRYGVNIDRKLMNNWLFKSAKLFAPLFVFLKEEIIRGNYLAIDETPSNMLDKSKSKQAYMWVYHSKDKGKKLLYYDFCLDRSSANPQLFIPNNYAGYIQIGSNGGFASIQINLNIESSSGFMDGDVNMDSVLNVLDVIILTNFILGTDLPSDNQFVLGDMNDDGLLNVLDVINLVNIILE